MKRVWSSAWAALAVMLLIGSSTAGAETVTVGGSGATDELMRRMGARFTHHTGIGVEVVKNMGSGGSLRAAVQGALDIAVSAQLPTPEQQARGLKVVFAFRTPFVFATSYPSPQSLTAADIVQAYATGKTWPDGSPVRVILRPKQSADTILMEGMFPDLAAAMDTARRRPDIPVASIDPDNADVAERTPGSLTGMTWLQVVMEKRRLRLVALGGVEPTQENLERGLYPYAKTFNFSLSPKARPAAERFIAFVRSSEGQDMYRQAIGY